MSVQESDEFSMEGVDDTDLTVHRQLTSGERTTSTSNTLLASEIMMRSLICESKGDDYEECDDGEDYLDPAEYLLDRLRHLRCEVTPEDDFIHSQSLIFAVAAHLSQNAVCSKEVSHFQRNMQVAVLGGMVGDVYVTRISTTTPIRTLPKIMGDDYLTLMRQPSMKVVGNPTLHEHSSVLSQTLEKSNGIMTFLKNLDLGGACANDGMEVSFSDICTESELEVILSRIDHRDREADSDVSPSSVHSMFYHWVTNTEKLKLHPIYMAPLLRATCIKANIWTEEAEKLHKTAFNARLLNNYSKGIYQPESSISKRLETVLVVCETIATDVLSVRLSYEDIENVAMNPEERKPLIYASVITLYGSAIASSDLLGVVNRITSIMCGHDGGVSAGWKTEGWIESYKNDPAARYFSIADSIWNERSPKRDVKAGVSAPVGASCHSFLISTSSVDKIGRLFQKYAMTGEDLHSRGWRFYIDTCSIKGLPNPSHRPQLRYCTHGRNYGVAFRNVIESVQRQNVILVQQMSELRAIMNEVGTQMLFLTSLGSSQGEVQVQAGRLSMGHRNISSENILGIARSLSTSMRSLINLMTSTRVSGANDIGSGLITESEDMYASIFSIPLAQPPIDTNPRRNESMAEASISSMITTSNYAPFGTDVFGFVDWANKVLSKMSFDLEKSFSGNSAKFLSTLCESALTKERTNMLVSNTLLAYAGKAIKAMNALASWLSDFCQNGEGVVTKWRMSEFLRAPVKAKYLSGISHRSKNNELMTAHLMALAMSSCKNLERSMTTMQDSLALSSARLA
jgi:hypothetical protein